MKKILFAFIVGCIPAATMISGAHAQNSKSVSTITDPKTFEASVSTADAAAKASELSTISTKAIKDFNNTYKGVTDAIWSKIQDGYVAWFKLHGIVNRTYYDKRGNWHFNISYYDEKNLPRDVRATVKSVYYDYNITGVEEIRVEDKVVYIVHVEDEKTLKTLKIQDGEMDIMQEFTK